jgi:hypothetical protein
MTGDGYQSDQAAQFAGEKAPTDFLADLSKEEIGLYVATDRQHDERS